MGISSVQTVRFKSELERNITIKLGYANAKIYRCTHPECYRPGSYASYGSATEDEPPCVHCPGKMELLRHVSFVDCPGHEVLMETMLNGAAVMDRALLLIAGNEPCPQPQTSEHLAAAEIMQLEHLMVLQNKVELVKPDGARNQHKEIKNFVQGSCAEDAPILPISAVNGYNVDVVAQYLCTYVPVPPRAFVCSPQMVVIRSFDVNKPGEEVKDLKGGAVGGSIQKGVFRVGMDIELRPGLVTKKSDGTQRVKSLKSKIQVLRSEANDLQYAVPGGLIAVGTKLDPTLTRQNGGVGWVLGVSGSMPSVFLEIDIRYYKMNRLVGVKESKDGDKSVSTKVKKLSSGEILQINVGSTSVSGKVTTLGSGKDDSCKILLGSPVCAAIGDKVAISRRIERTWRLIAWGTITKG